MTSSDHREGVREGLRLALATLASEEAKLERRLDTGASSQTRRDQRVRHKAIQTAQTRIRTALNAQLRASAKRGDSAIPEIWAGIARLGL
jgi:hypothetical protein